MAVGSEFVPPLLFPYHRVIDLKWGSFMKLVWIVVACSLLATPVFANCGKERWAVKTGTDADAAQVQVSSFTPTSIASLIGLAPPNPLPPSNRVPPVETTMWVVNATLTSYKLEDDSDYHLVLRDDAGQTMIAEIPSPDCVGSGSPFANQIRNARLEFDARLQASKTFQVANLPVEVRGVGFFDFKHGQTGVAPNAIELHPVLDIIFNPGSASLYTSSLIMDPGFEAGPNFPTWQASPGVFDNSTKQPAHSGTYKAWLGGYGKVHTDTLSQTITIPATATQATLSLWILVETEESGPNPYDRLKVQVRDPGGAVLATLASYSNLDANGGYEQKIFDMSRFKGQRIKIYFQATEDPAKVTSFVIDDLALTTVHQ